jgi:hypothetical protein
MVNLHKKGDFVKITKSQLGNSGTLGSILENDGNIWKIIDINMTNSIYYILRNINPKLEKSMSIYSVFHHDVEKLEDPKDGTFQDYINSFRNTEGIKDAEQQCDALEKFSKGEIDYATMRDRCG